MCCIALILPVIFTEIFEFGDTEDHYNTTMKITRYFEFAIYLFVGVASVIIGIFFAYRVKKYMYLYYQDFKKNLLLSIFGLIAYMFLIMVHVCRSLCAIFKWNCYPATYDTDY